MLFDTHAHMMMRPLTRIGGRYWRDCPKRVSGWW